MRGAGASLMRVRFTLHHDLQVKDPFLQKTTMMSMKVHVSSLLPPIYRNFYPCVEKIKFFKHFDVAPPREIMCASGTSRPPPPPKLSGELSSQAPYVHTELVLSPVNRDAKWNEPSWAGFPDWCGRTNYNDNGRCLKLSYYPSIVGTHTCKQMQCWWF